MAADKSRSRAICCAQPALFRVCWSLTHVSEVSTSKDELTRLLLRSAFVEASDAAIESARAADCPLALLVVDVDHFKLVNDTYGHLQGDSILVEVADLLQRNLRTYDIAGRYG